MCEKNFKLWKKTFLVECEKKHFELCEKKKFSCERKNLVVCEKVIRVHQVKWKTKDLKTSELDNNSSNKQDHKYIVSESTGINCRCMA